MRYEYTSIEFINDTDEIASYYASIERVMQKVDPHTYKNLLIKQEGWVAVCAYDKFGGENMIEVLTNSEYSCGELKSVTWDMLEPIVLKIQPTEKGIEELFRKSVGWTVLFAGSPDWMILFPAPEDFWLIAGKPDFVEKILGSSIEEGFASLDELITQSIAFSEEGRRAYSYFLRQFRDVYPTLKAGEAVDFGFT